ncbi:uncharacterized protein LOC119081268 [Bradysia coprophila]|uniref:uncharacterized protein LOC119081268 n=1 Tax=Bradysia coprophila TaxID=38358 RepID=UPI00187DD3EB|nr:uncharacterized protein LOC119081268 [Bradysia coprophila]
MSRKSAPGILQTTNSLIEKKEFRFTVRKVKQLTTFSSATVNVNGVPWQVKLKKNGENVIIELQCNYINPNAYWSCAARAVIKLLSFATNSDMYEKRQDAVAVFSSKLPSITRSQELIKWNDLLDSKRQHVCNNTIVLDVSIQAEKLRDSSQSRLIEVERLYGHSILRFKMAKVKGVIAMDSPKFIFRNVACELTISKRYPLTKKELDTDKYGYLGIWLISESVDTSKYDIQVTFRLLSQRIGGKHVEKLADSTSSNRLNFSSRLIPLHELYESPHEYVRNDSLILEVVMSERISEDPSMSAHSGLAKKIVMECILCYENMIDQPISSTPCGHIFCSKCTIETLRVRPSCPICNKFVRVGDVHAVFLPSIQQNE